MNGFISLCGETFGGLKCNTDILMNGFISLCGETFGGLKCNTDILMNGSSACARRPSEGF
jgi:hypothetical protein